MTTLGYKFSKCFGPTDSGAGAKTAIGSTYLIPPDAQGSPQKLCIRKIHVAKGNVVDGKELAGVVIVEITGLGGTYEYAYGNGVAAVASGNAGPNEEIDCRIPASSGGTITVSITDAEVATTCLVSLDFFDGSERVDSYSAGGAGIDPAAATLKEIGTITINRAGRIKQIRYACGNIVNAKSPAGKLVLVVPGQPGPYEFAVGLGAGGATIGGGGPADVFDVDIPAGLNVIITCNVTYTDATDSATISLAVA